MRVPPFVQGPERADGRTPMVVNPMKGHVRPYYLLPKQPNTTLALAGANAVGELLFEVDLEGHFEWESLVTSPQDAPASLVQVVLNLFDAQKQRFLSNRPVHFQTIAAIVDRAFRLPEPYLFNVGDGIRTMNVLAKKLDSGSFTLNLAMLGRRYYHVESPPHIARKFDEVIGNDERAHVYFMTYKEVAGDGTPPVIAAGGQETFHFRADDDADSDLHKLMVPAGTGDFSFTLREADTNRQLSNGLISRQMGWGDAEFPFYFADTYLLGRSKELIFEVTNESGDDLQIFATIAGRRLITEE